MQKDLKISIIVPVLNEGTNINTFISYTKDICLGRNFELIVVDGSENGTTVNLIKDPCVIKTTSQKDRSIQMNEGAKLASGGILIFLHSDTFLTKESIPEILRVLEKPKINAGAFDIIFDKKSPLFSFLAFTANIRSRISRNAYGDQAQYFKKEYFKNIGGYKNIPIMEDVEIMQRIKKRGGKIYISEKKIITSVRRWEKDGFLKTTLNNHIIRILYFLGAAPNKLLRFK